MRYTFLTWLFGLVCAVFALTMGYSHFSFMAEAEGRAAQMMSARLSDLMELLQHSDDYMETLQDLTDNAALEKTRAAAEILRLNPQVIDDEEKLQGICNDLDAKQLILTDETGVICHALPRELIGKDLSAFDDEDSLRACIHNPGREVSLKAGATLMDTAVQYAAVHRQDAPGVLLMGFRGAREQSAWAATSFANLAQNYDLGQRGVIIAFKEGAVLGDDTPPFPTADLISLPLNKATKLRMGDTSYFTYAIRRDGYRLVGVLPEKELRSSSRHSFYPVLVANAILIPSVMVIIMYLLQRLVVRNISKLTTSLRHISQGHTSERINSEEFPMEFRKLTTGINTMADALQAHSKRDDEAADREMEQARAIQNALIPHTFPAFPLHTEFDLFATCRRAKTVGGGFYDYFMRGDEQLCFMVADTTGSGTPAALFAMHCISLIRELARAYADPAELFAEINSALCETPAAEMHLSLFYGMLHIRTGELVCTIAGHTQAFICRKGSAYSCPEIPPSVELGSVPHALYEPTVWQLAPGDRLFICTDGVTEVADPQQALFGDEHLMQALNTPAESIADVPRKVMRALRAFARGSEQTRDCTMLALEFIGHRREAASCRLLAQAPEAAEAFVAEHLEAVFASPPAISALQQAVRSIASALPADTPLTLELEYDEEAATATLSYPLPSLNPLTHLPKLPTDSAEHSCSESGPNTITLRQALA